MMYLIGQLGAWLLVTAAFAALAGWGYAAIRAAPGENQRRRERERLLRDIIAFGEEAPSAGTSAEVERELDSLRRRADIDAARVAELERGLAAARSRAEDGIGRAAELERELGRDSAQEIARLSAELALLRGEEARTIEVEPVSAPDEASVLQAWRLRYFEQRVRYLEGQPPQAAVSPDSPDPVWEWRARTAEARVAHLEDERRLALAGAADAGEQEPLEAPPFAANAQTDMLLRWRMLYLEKRAAHLEAELGGARAEAQANAVDGEAAERWKWRTRFLEARTRHLDGRLAANSGQASSPTPAAPASDDAAAAPSVAPRRPALLLAARGGAPDDFTLIDGVSAMQQNTLYSLGIYHFDQVAAWDAANVAWVDSYLRLRGRIVEEEWVEQAEELAREGVPVARRAESEDA